MPKRDPSYRTKLNPSDELDFQTWYALMAARFGLNPNPDDPLHYYDYRGAYQGGIRPSLNSIDNQMHWPDTYKVPGHPTFSVESKYYKPGMKAGRWQGENFIPFEVWSRGGQ